MNTHVKGLRILVWIIIAADAAGIAFNSIAAGIAVFFGLVAIIEIMELVVYQAAEFLKKKEKKEE